MPNIRLRILGESVVEIGERTITPDAPHLFALLLYLCVERGRAIVRSELAALLFPDDSDSARNHNLRQLLYRARRLGVPLESVASTLQLDATAIDDGLQATLRDRSHVTRKGCAIAYVLLPHYAPPTAPLSQWLESYRDRINQEILRHLGLEMQAARKRADWRVVESLASACLSLDAYNETATLLLAEALALTGSKQKAIDLLRRFEQDVGRTSDSLTLPSRLLKRRISESPIVRTEAPATPLIGRANEMQRLIGYWETARNGTCTVVHVSGEKHIGKSRLVGELLSTVRLQASGTCLSTRRVPADRRRPMSLFADVCKQLVCIPGAAGCSPLHVPFLSRLMEAPSGHASLRVEEFEAQYSQAGVRNAVIDLFESVCSEQAIVCHVDDADHLDDASLELLHALRDHLSACPLLFILSGQSMREGVAQHIHALRVLPLDAPSATSLATELRERGTYQLDDSALDWCVSTALGNPGHLEMLMAHASRSASSLEIPPDLVALTDARLASLSSAALHALQACVVFGSDCKPPTITALTGLTKYRLLTALQSLEESSLLISSPEGLRCSSVLVEDRVSASTSQIVRRLIHGRAARHLETLARRIPASQAMAWRIAEHSDQAGDSESALYWRRICWRQLIAIGQPMVAAASIRAQLSQAQNLETRAALLDVLGDALHSAGETAALLVALHARSALSPHLRDTATTRRALEFDIAEAATLNDADPTPYYESLKQQMCSSDLDSSRRSRASRILMIAADNAVDPNFAHEIYRLHSLVTPEDARSALLHLHARLIYHSVFGSRDEARACAESLEQLSLEGECSWLRTSSLCNLSLTRRIVDKVPPTYDRLERCFEECRNAGMDSLALLLSCRLTTFLFDDGLIDEAVRWGRCSRELTDALGVERHSGDYLTSQIDLALISGRFSRAQTLIDTIPSTWSVTAQPRLSKEFLVYQSRVSQFLGNEAGSDEQLDLLLNWHQRARCYSRHDDHMEVLWVALNSRGRAEEASKLLEEYLTSSRRELRPCNYLLRARTSVDPAWGRIGSGENDRIRSCSNASPYETGCARRW